LVDGPRYVSQLVYGCQNPSCTTPTCFSCRRRITVAPLRRLTAVSARTIACYLASQDDAEKALCPHKPIIPLEAKDVRATRTDAWCRGTRKVGTESKETEEAAPGPAPKHNPNLDNAQSTGIDDTKVAPIPPNRAEPVDPLTEVKPEEGKTHTRYTGRRQTKKDPKSFTQNLFDTFHMRMLEWLSLPKVAHTFAFAPEGREDECTSGPPNPPQNGPPKKPPMPAPQQNRQVVVASSTPTAIIKSHSDEHSPSAQTPTPTPAQQASFEQPPATISLTTSPKVRRRRSLGHPDTHRQQSQSIKERLQPSGLARQPRLPPPITPYSHPSDIALPSLPPSISKHHQQHHNNGFIKGYNVAGKNHENHRRNSWNGARTLQLPQTTPSRVSEKDLASKDRNLVEIPKDTVTTEDEKTSTYDSCFIRPPQSLSHLSCKAIEALVQLVESTDTMPKEERLFTRSFGTVKAAQKAVLKHIDTLKNPEWTIGGLIEDLTKLRYNPHVEAERFAEQSIFYVLSNSSAILESFRDGEPEEGNQGQSISRPSPLDLDQAFRLLMKRNSALIFNSLWVAAEALFTPPPELIPPSPRLRTAISSASTCIPGSPVDISPRGPPRKNKYFTDPEAAHIVIVCLHALVASLPNATQEAWLAIHKLRAQGKVVPDSNLVGTDKSTISSMLDAVEALEDEMALRLMKRLTRAVAARTYFTEIIKTRSRKRKHSRSNEGDQRSIMEIVLDHFARCERRGSNDSTGDFPLGWGEEQGPTGWSIPAFLLEWIRSALLKEWDGKEEVSRWSIAGGSIGMLSSLCEYHISQSDKMLTNSPDERRESLGLSEEIFQSPFISDRLDSLEIPVEWLSSNPSNKVVHLLSNPFLFPHPALVTYLRAINFSNMSRSFEASMTMLRLVTQMAFVDPLPGAGGLLPRLQKAVSHYLVLEVRRDNLLTDALDQLWRREKRELMRPLKVRMGMDEGEEGVDHGGVQQEFFRIAMTEALAPEYGILFPYFFNHVHLLTETRQASSRQILKPASPGSNPPPLNPSTNTSSSDFSSPLLSITASPSLSRCRKPSTANSWACPSQKSHTSVTAGRTSREASQNFLAGLMATWGMCLSGHMSLVWRDGAQH
jgi:Amino-terminal Zinc-binding domain of ubiquitin ligase E3A